MRFKNQLCLMISLLSFAAALSFAAPPSMQDMQVPVVGYKVVQKTIADNISLVGTLEANEQVEIKSEIDGTIEEINFEEGQVVKKGEPLFLIDQRKLKASLDQAEANLKLAETTNNRYQSLTDNGAISRQEYEQASADLEINRAAVELAKAQLHDATITAPFDGVMGNRMVSKGQYISKGSSLSFLTNQDPIKANFRVPERYLSRVSVGQPIEMKVAAYPDESFKGEVFFIDSRVDELTRTALIKARVGNPDGKLRQGMFANLQLTVEKKQNAVIVPESALILRSDEVFVWVINEDTTAAIKPVKVGIRQPGFVEITEGLLEGETVIVEGYQKIAPGVKTMVRFEEDTEEKK